MAYGLLSNGKGFEIKVGDGLELQSRTSNLHVEIAHPYSTPVLLPNVKSDNPIAGLVAATWSSCSSVIFRTATVVRAQSVARKSLKLSFDFIDNESKLPTSYISDHRSLIWGLSYPPLPTSVGISPIQIYDADNDFVATVDPRGPLVTATARGASLEIESTQVIKPSVDSSFGDVTVCVRVMYGKHKVQGCRIITLVSLVSIRLRGLQWPVPADISKEKNTIFSLDSEGRMQNLQFNATAVSSASTEHDISHLCAPKRYCGELGCSWYALEFDVEDATGGSHISCGKLTLGSRARLDHTKYLESNTGKSTVEIEPVYPNWNHNSSAMCGA